MKNVTPIKVFDYVKGTKIAVPGIYRNVPMSAYHGDICVGPSISSSGIRTIESESLLHFWDTFYGNPDRAEEEPKHHFSLGKAVHHLAGGEKNFAKAFAVRPSQWDSWRTNDAKKWRAEQYLAEMEVLEPKDIEVIRGVAKALEAHPVIRAGILEGLIEHSIFWKRKFLVNGKVVTIWCKARPDVLSIVALLVNDLKTTTDASRAAVMRTIGDLGYHIQLGMIHDGYLAVTGQRLEEHVLTFVEVKRPFGINIKPVSPLAIEYGRRQLERGLEKFATAIATNCWPGYADDEEEVGLTSFHMDRLKKEAENRTLPAPWEGVDDLEDGPEPTGMIDDGEAL